MGQRTNVRAWCAALCLLAFVCLAPLPVAARACEDCELIKQRQVEATRMAVAMTPAPPATAAPVVRLALYWAEGCGHCHEVLDGLLPRLQQAYGAQLEVRMIEVVSLEDISAFFDLAEAYGYGRGRATVPFLVIGDRALMGVAQIAAELPGLVESALAAGGTARPTPPVQQNAAGQAAATADDTCSFTAPCPEGTAVTAGAAGAQAGSPGRRWPFAAVAVSALGLALVVGGAIGLQRLRLGAGK